MYIANKSTEQLECSQILLFSKVAKFSSFVFEPLIMLYHDDTQTNVVQQLSRPGLTRHQSSRGTLQGEQPCASRPLPRAERSCNVTQARLCLLFTASLASCYLSLITQMLICNFKENLFLSFLQVCTNSGQCACEDGFDPASACDKGLPVFYYICYFLIWIGRR